MKRTEMIKFLLTEEYYIKHRYAGEEEFFYMIDGELVDHEGLRFGGINDEFLELRKGDYWEYDWLVKPINTSFIDNEHELILEFKNAYPDRMDPFIYTEDVEYDTFLNPCGVRKPQANPNNVKSTKGVCSDVKSRDLLTRNDPCSCGSGKKYKRCCYGKN